MIKNRFERGCGKKVLRDVASFRNFCLHMRVSVSVCLAQLGVVPLRPIRPDQATQHSLANAQDAMAGVLDAVTDHQ